MPRPSREPVVTKDDAAAADSPGAVRRWWERSGWFVVPVLVLLVVWTAVLVSLFVPEPFWERENPLGPRGRTYGFLTVTPLFYGFYAWWFLRWAERFTPGYRRREALRRERARHKRRAVEETVDRLFPGG